MNDSIWFSKFDWDNSKNPAEYVSLDIHWREIGGNSFIFLDAFLENGLYVTIGLRQIEGGYKRASMSVFKHGATESIFNQIHSSPGNGFQCQSGGEGDKYCIGNYQFELKEYYQFIIKATEKRVIGEICQLQNKEVTRIATFLTGDASLIKAKSSNGIALEHFGMNDPCKYKSQIVIKNPLRIDTKKLHSNARGGTVSYQKCRNSDIIKGSGGEIILSHGGNTIRGTVCHGDFIKWS